MKFWVNSIFYGVILLAIGVIIWLSNLHIIHIVWRRDWPVILIAIGVLELIKAIIRR
ncbi:MAG: DUF5668 domain-containing protein [candidate division WOR-3 bacterium]